jgi:hypothetical protein
MRHIYLPKQEPLAVRERIVPAFDSPTCPHCESGNTRWLAPKDVNFMMSQCDGKDRRTFMCLSCQEKSQMDREDFISQAEQFGFVDPFQVVVIPKAEQTSLFA